MTIESEKEMISQRERDCDNTREDRAVGNVCVTVLRERKR